MIRVSELTGEQLDYWTARAEGIPAEQLSIRRVPRTDNLICVRRVLGDYFNGPDIARLAYSTDWAQGGPLIHKYRINHMGEVARLEWNVHFGPQFDIVDGQCVKRHPGAYGEGDTPLQAICRAVVRAAFGDEVEEVAVCE